MANITIIETGRLYLREMTTADAENAYELNADPEVIQYTGDAAFKSIEDAYLFLQHYDHYKKYGCGRWAVINKNDECFLGWCGLKYNTSFMEYDLGYRFFRKYWNQGYATEAAIACVEYGFKKLQLKEIIGRAMKKNIASIAVLKKAGLVHAGSFLVEGADAVIYSINRNEVFNKNDRIN